MDALDELEEVETIEISDEGMFTCVECENDVNPQVAGETGNEDADLNKISEELSLTPNKLIYTFCPVCGMEYQFKLETTEAEEDADEDVEAVSKLVLIPSDEEK